MDKPSVSVAVTESANPISVQESQFPYDGIFSPHGFLSTIPSITSEHPGDDGSTAKVDGECQDQGQLPPKKKLKKQTTRKNGTEVMMTDNDLPPALVAFGIDHILEKILHSLETSDLLKCRSVCRRWGIIANPELQKRLELTFSDNLLRGISWQQWQRKSEYELQQLTLLLMKKFLRFPCQKFAFETTWCSINNGNILSTQLDNFLDTYGIHIQSLRIKSCLAPFNQNMALAEIRQLLINQTPNFRKFSLTLKTRKGTNAELILDTEAKNPEAYKNKSLKTLRMYTDSLSVWGGARQLQGRLPDLIYEYDCVRKSSLNTLYLLKKFHLKPSPLRINFLEKVVMASLDTPGKLKLRRITIDSWVSWVQARRETQKTVPYLELERKFVSVLNHLLDCSWDTLKTIKWNNVTCLKGVEWGKAMSNGKNLELIFSIYVERAGKYVGSLDANLFPPGRGLSTIFPKLSSIKILYECEESDFIKFLNHLNPGEEVINSVNDALVQNINDGRVASTEASELVRKFFPNAEIQYRVMDLQYYY